MPRTSALARVIEPRMDRSALCEDVTLVDTRHDNAIRWRPGERLQHLFEQRCDEIHAGNGPHEAIVTEGATYGFRDLDNRANQVARFLREQGIKAGDRVALMFDKGVHTYVALLAVLKVNAAYVPLDASFPNERIGFILKDYIDLLQWSQAGTAILLIAATVIAMDHASALIRERLQ